MFRFREMPVGGGFSPVRLRLVVIIFLVIAPLMLLAGCGGRTDEETPRVQERILLLHERAGGALAEGSYHVALHNLENALSLHRSVDDRVGEAFTLISRGRVLLVVGRYNEAEGAFTRARELSEEEGDNRLLAESFASMGKLHNLRGEYHEAIMSLTRAIDLDRKIGGSQLGGRLNLIGIAYRSAGSYDEARGALEEALKVNKRGDIDRETANSHRNIGDLLVEEKRYSDAFHHYTKALALDKKLGESRKIGRDLEALAGVELLEKRVESAVPLLERAYKVYVN
ncbi:MAG: tetratricopeptide repeat protein, partial [Thermodesulfobacteriota bacterium]